MRGAQGAKRIEALIPGFGITRALLKLIELGAQHVVLRDRSVNPGVDGLAVRSEGGAAALLAASLRGEQGYDLRRVTGTTALRRGVMRAAQSFIRGPEIKDFALLQRDLPP